VLEIKPGLVESWRIRGIRGRFVSKYKLKHSERPDTVNLLTGKLGVHIQRTIEKICKERMFVRRHIHLSILLDHGYNDKRKENTRHVSRRVVAVERADRSVVKILFYLVKQLSNTLDRRFDLDNKRSLGRARRCFLMIGS
jgi:hypothetical protein